MDHKNLAVRLIRELSRFDIDASLKYSDDKETQLTITVSYYPTTLYVGSQGESPRLSKSKQYNYVKNSIKDDITTAWMRASAQSVISDKEMNQILKPDIEVIEKVVEKRVPVSDVEVDEMNDAINSLLTKEDIDE